MSTEADIAAANDDGCWPTGRRPHGAIALGHLLAALNTRLSLTLGRAVAVRGVHFGITAMSGGGGQGAAIPFKLPDYHDPRA